jgi:hypothetical protein
MEKNQNNKTSYGVEAFLENNMLFFHTLKKSIFYKKNPMPYPK